MNLLEAKNEFVAAAGFDGVRVDQIFALVEQANALPAGDYVEIGTCQGHTLKLIHAAMDQSRLLYSFDTFNGFVQEDIDAEKAKGFNHPWIPGTSENPAGVSFHPTSPQLVSDYLGNPPNLRLVPGRIPGTFRGFDHLRFRFAHIDVDLYLPTVEALRFVWPRMVPGGLVLMHDYGEFWLGARPAIDEFCREHGVTLEILRDHHVSVLLRN